MVPSCIEAFCSQKDKETNQRILSQGGLSWNTKVAEKNEQPQSYIGSNLMVIIQWGSEIMGII